MFWSRLNNLSIPSNVLPIRQYRNELVPKLPHYSILLSVASVMEGGQLGVKHSYIYLHLLALPYCNLMGPPNLNIHRRGGLIIEDLLIKPT